MSPELFEQTLDHLFNIGILNACRPPPIYLYNWGEPFLNPNINDIISILKKNNLHAGISSNFIVRPEIDKGNLPVINDVRFSLSGFSQDTYGRIHGASLQRVLEHFEYLYKQISTHAPGTITTIAWHRYAFNESELWKAFKYFDRPGIFFNPVIAYLNDLPEMLSFANACLSDDRRRQAEKDMFLDHISQQLSYHRLRSKRYKCFMWNQLVIDEYGQLLLCCGFSNKGEDKRHIAGNVLEMSAEEIWQKKLSDPLCKTCIATGLPRAIRRFNNKPLPHGRLGDYCKLWYHQMNLSNGPFQYALSQVAGIVQDLPFGERLFRLINHFRGRF
jgi:MoaA/NifB/PqqE/SkfB family radical SAM enzyme